MDNQVFIRLQSTLYQIKNILLADPEVRKLLYYSTEELGKKSLEQMKEVTQAAVEDNIYLQLVVDMDTTPPFNKRNFISIFLSDGSCDDQEVMTYAINVALMSEKHDWIIGNDIRPLRLAQKVIDLIDGKKLELSNKMFFNHITQQIVNDDVYGYTLIFAASDGAHNVD